MTHNAGFKTCSICKERFRIDQEVENIICPGCGSNDELRAQHKQFEKEGFK